MTFADEMVIKYQTLLRDAAGFRTVTVDGQLVTYDELEKRYEFWNRKAGAEQGKRPIVAQIDLGGF